MIRPAAPGKPNGAGTAQPEKRFVGKKPIAGGLVFSLKAGNKPPETADDPAASGPYDAIYKNIQGDGRWVFRDGHY
jgi:hypothetical protein